MSNAAPLFNAIMRLEMDFYDDSSSSKFVSGFDFAS
jgi:hypothetical protein